MTTLAGFWRREEEPQGETRLDCRIEAFHEVRCRHYINFMAFVSDSVHSASRTRSSCVRRVCQAARISETRVCHRTRHKNRSEGCRSLKLSQDSKTAYFSRGTARQLWLYVARRNLYEVVDGVAWAMASAYTDFPLPVGPCINRLVVPPFDLCRVLSSIGRPKFRSTSCFSSSKPITSSYEIAGCFIIRRYSSKYSRMLVVWWIGSSLGRYLVLRGTTWNGFARGSSWHVEISRQLFLISDQFCWPSHRKGTSSGWQRIRLVLLILKNRCRRVRARRAPASRPVWSSCSAAWWSKGEVRLDRAFPGTCIIALEYWWHAAGTLVEVFFGLTF